MRAVKITFVVLCSFLVCACTSSSLLVSHPKQMASDLDAIRAGRANNLVGEARQVSGPNALLYYLENGRIAQISNRAEISKTYFSDAIALIDGMDEKARISVTGTAAQGGALLINDNAIPYRGEAYEHVLLHTFQSLNYLMAGDLSAAAVEARRSVARQREALEKHHREMAKAQEGLNSVPVDLDATMGQLDLAMRQSGLGYGHAKFSFQNAYAYFISGLVFELGGEWNNAYIDYSHALELAPQNPMLQRQVQRLAKQLGFRPMYRALSRSLGPLPSPGADEGAVVVLYESGFVQAKIEQVLPVHLSDGKVLSIAFAGYPANQPAFERNILVRNEDVAVTVLAPLADTRVMAEKRLQEQAPAMIARLVGRALLKSEIYNQAEQANQGWGGFFANVYNLITERADLRNWLTLPAQMHFARFSLPEGTHRLQICHTGTATCQPETVTVRHGGMSIVHIIEAGTHRRVEKAVY